MKKVFVLFCCIIFSQFVFSQSKTVTADLNVISPDWYLVPGGNSLTAPVKNSVGYISIFEGKNVISFSDDGKILWQKSISVPLSRFITSGYADSIYLVTGSSKSNLTVLNSTGTEIWKKNAGFKIISRPFTGRDGRIFVNGRNNISCYGINGKRKWTLETENLSADYEAMELNDGSLVYITESEIDGKSVSLRISPFGKLLEKIVFDGKIKKACTCKNGLFLLFENGKAGLCSVKQNSADSLWIIEGSNRISDIASDLYSNEAAFISEKSQNVYFIDLKDGKIVSNVNLESINPSATVEFSKTENGTFISDSKYSYFIGSDRKISWKAKNNPYRKASYMLTSDSGYLILLFSDWTMSGYRMTQKLKNKKSGKNSASKNEPKDYNAFYKPYMKKSYSFSPQLNSIKNPAQIKEIFKIENYGEQELQCIPFIKQELANITEDFSIKARNYSHDKSFYKINTEYTESVITAASLSGLTIFYKDFAQLLKSTDDETLLISLVNAAKNTGFDPDESFLKAFEILIQNTPASKTELLLDSCDAVYEICRYMGKPAFYAHGKNILTNLLSMKYNQTIHEYAVQTLSKLSILQ